MGEYCIHKMSGSERARIKSCRKSSQSQFLCVARQRQAITLTSLRFTGRQRKIVDVNTVPGYPAGLPLQEELSINGMKTGPDSCPTLPLISVFEDENREISAFHGEN